MVHSIFLIQMSDAEDVNWTTVFAVSTEEKAIEAVEEYGSEFSMRRFRYVDTYLYQ